MLAFAAVKYFYLLHFSLQNKKMAFLKEEFKSRTKLDKFKIKKKNFIFLDYGQKYSKTKTEVIFVLRT